MFGLNERAVNRWAGKTPFTQWKDFHLPGVLCEVPQASNLDPAYFAVGIANSAPFSVLSGQRCMMDFCFV